MEMRIVYIHVSEPDSATFNLERWHWALVVKRYERSFHYINCKRRRAALKPEILLDVLTSDGKLHKGLFEYATYTSVPEWMKGMTEEAKVVLSTWLQEKKWPIFFQILESF